MSYAEFLAAKAQLGAEHGFAPAHAPVQLFSFQRALLEWAQRKGRGLVAADCGMGKTAIQLAWAENVVRQTNRSVLVLTPLAVAQQTVREAEKFGIEARRSAGRLEPGAHVVVTNYEKLHHFSPGDFGGVVLDESSCIKAFDGRRRAEVTEFMRTIPTGRCGRRRRRRMTTSSLARRARPLAKWARWTCSLASSRTTRTRWTPVRSGAFTAEPPPAGASRVTRSNHSGGGCARGRAPAASRPIWASRMMASSCLRWRDALASPRPRGEERLRLLRQGCDCWWPRTLAVAVLPKWWWSSALHLRHLFLRRTWRA